MAMRIVYVVSLAAAFVQPAIAQGFDVPEISLDLPEPHVCIHLREWPASYGTTLLFASGRDFCTARLLLLAQVLCAKTGISLSHDLQVRAVRLYEQEHLLAAVNHPLLSLGLLDVTALLHSLRLQELLGESQIIARQEFHIDGRPLRIHYIESKTAKSQAHQLGQTLGNDLII